MSDSPHRKCVVFDVDDTLYLERSYVRSGFAAVGDHLRDRHGVEGFGDRAWALFLQGHRGNIFDLALDRQHAALVPELVDVYRRHRPTIELLPDAKHCLATLRGRAALAALTDGPATSQHRKVEALALASWCRPIVVTADLGPNMGKPSAAGFERIMQELDVNASDCTYIGDNPKKDFVAPARLGWTTIRVRRQEGLHTAEPSGPDVQQECADLRLVPKVLSLS